MIIQHKRHIGPKLIPLWVKYILGKQIHVNDVQNKLTAKAVPPIPPANAQVPNIPKTVFLTLSGYHAPRDFMQLGQH